MPLSWLFSLLVQLRRLCYRTGLLKVHSISVPVIVVGNITVGGSGKTPLVIRLAEFLKQAGYRPGIVSRGYGGKSAHWPQPVLAESDTAMVGDEPVLIARRTGCPMRVGPDRVAAVQSLIADEQVDLIISDDGMQHYRLGRDIEIAVIDGQRRFGNGLCLPAGPLREPVGRLRSVDMIVCNGEGVQPGEYRMELELQQAVSLADEKTVWLSSFAGKKLHAIAGIGHPLRFFDALRRCGIDIIEHPFPDHYPFRQSDIDFGDEKPVLMTEKDGVKCIKLATGREWQVPVETRLPDAFGERLLVLLKKR